MLRFLLVLKLLCLTACATQGGIGIGFDRDNIVRLVVDGSPAEAADIRLGDQLLAPLPHQGPVGTMCFVKGVRDNVVYEKQVKRVDANSFRQKWGNK